MRRRSKVALGLATLALLSSLAFAAGQGSGGHEVAVVPLPPTDANTRFGGFSGIEVSPDGQRFWAISDRGALAEGKLLRNSAGRLTGVTVDSHQRLNDPDNIPTSGVETDSEGLARSPDGRLYVSFEGYHRIWTYRPEGGEAAWFPRHPDFKKMQANSSLEALAIDQDGALYTLPERSGSYGTPFPVYRYGNEGWQVIGHIPREGEWLPVGADFDDRGQLYLLWRHFTGYGFSSRVTRHALQGDDWSGETVYQTRPLTHGNLEGLSLWRNASGTLKAVLVTDDNFRAIQRSELVEITLPE